MATDSPHAEKLLGKIAMGGGLTLGGVIVGITLSLLHQSGLGALFLMAREKIHPLWYSEFLPLMFLISSIFAGLSMVIFEGSITHKIFHHRLGERLKATNDDIVLGLARICAATMFVYVFAQILVFVHGHRAPHLGTGWGAWYLLEIVGFTAVPAVLYAYAVQRRHLSMIKVAAVMTLVGIVLNRLNVSIIAFKWYAPTHYVPTWMEIVVTLGVISVELWVFRWVVNRMPVLDFNMGHGDQADSESVATRHVA
jgi:Ni/Fe-hydrogenase subunit HybB-like protein